MYSFISLEEDKDTPSARQPTLFNQPASHMVLQVGYRLRFISCRYSRNPLCVALSSKSFVRVKPLPFPERFS